MIFYDAVWIRRDNNNGVLKTEKSILKYILVYTSIYHVYNSIHNVMCSTYLLLTFGLPE